MSERYTGTHIVHITDTGGEAERDRIDSAYVLETGAHGINPYHLRVVHADSTIEIGSRTGRLVNNPKRAERLIIAVNCAPPDNDKGTLGNHRNDFFMADLGDGIVVCGTRAGFEMSYIKDRIKHLYRLTVSNEKDSQFRNLETLPEYAVPFSDLEKRKGLLESGKIEEVPVDQYIRPVPDVSHVYKVDDSNNVTFYVSKRDRELLERTQGKKVRISFGEASVEVAGDTVQAYSEKFEAEIVTTFFEKEINRNYVTLKSSEKIDGHNLPQILTLRHRHTVTKPGYPVPVAGAPIKIELING